MEQVLTESNDNLITSELPQLAGLTPQPLAHNYAQVSKYVSLAITGILAAIGSAIAYQPFFPLPDKAQNIIIFITIVVGLLGLLSAYIGAAADRRKWYALRELDISFHSGLIFKDTVTQPILRVQHVELKRGPIDRKVGFAKLQVFSAGGALHTFEIPGLPLAEAEQVRQFILTHKDASQHG